MKMTEIREKARVLDVKSGRIKKIGTRKNHTD